MERTDHPLTDQVAVISGASSGLGRATAVAMARAGAHVALLARDANHLQDVAAEIETVNRRALPLSVDLAREENITAAIEQVIDTFGRVDVLVNAAGTDVPGPVATLATSDWDYVLAVNLRAPFLLAKTVFQHMQRAGGGTIINVSSVAGKRGWANAAAYCASKFGLTGLTQALAAEGKGHGIRACVVYPGAMATHWGAWSPQERDAQQRAPAPPTKSLPPTEVAALLVWIASAPPELVLNEAIVSPLEEAGWP